MLVVPERPLTEKLTDSSLSVKEVEILTCLLMLRLRRGVMEPMLSVPLRLKVPESVLDSDPMDVL